MHETRIASFGSVASVVGSGAMFTDGFVNAAAALFVVGVLAALVGLHFAGVKVKARLTPSSSAGRRVATIAVVGMILTTAALAGVGGPASPVESARASIVSEQCDELDLFITGVTLGTADLLRDNSCFVDPSAASENLTQTDVYANALAQNDTTEVFHDTQNNLANDRRSVAWAKAKLQIVNDLNNNVSEANATANAQAVVDEYYSNATKQVFEYHSSQNLQIAYWANATDGSNTTKSSVVTYQNPNDGSLISGIYGDEVTLDITFPDGTTETYYAVGYSDSTDRIGFGFDDTESGYSIDNRSAEFGTVSGVSPTAIRVSVVDPETDTPTQFADFRDARALQREYNDQRQQVNSNINQYVTDVYAAYQAGEINATDLAASDPTTIATQAATDYDSTGYYGMASAQLAALGLSGNESVSHVVNTTENGSARQIEGTLFYTGEDNQTFENGETYDPSNLSGSVYMSVASIEDGDGNALNHSGGFYYVDEPFTISSATNTQTGEAVNSTEMEKRDYTTTNASALSAEIDRLQELREYYEQQQSSSGGISLDFGGIETGAIIALLAVAFLATRN